MMRAFRDRLGQGDALFVVLQSGEYLVRIAVEQSDESHPLLLVVLEAHHVTVQFLRTGLRHSSTGECGSCSLVSAFWRFLLVLLHADIITPARDRRGRWYIPYIQSAMPLRKGVDHEFFVYVVGEVDRHADGVVHPFLDGTLHAAPSSASRHRWRWLCSKAIVPRARRSRPGCSASRCRCRLHPSIQGTSDDKRYTPRTESPTSSTKST